MAVDGRQARAVVLAAHRANTVIPTTGSNDLDRARAAGRGSTDRAHRASRFITGPVLIFSARNGRVRQTHHVVLSGFTDCMRSRRPWPIPPGASAIFC